MAYRLSKKSFNNLVGVEQNLVDCVTTAIQLTSIDFAVNEGLRTVARQKLLVANGASRTMNSKHLTGHAVDLVAVIGGRISWEPELYYPIAEAMRTAAEHLNVTLIWGGAWHISNIADWYGSMRMASKNYINLRKSQHKEAFLDFPHFQTES